MRRGKQGGAGRKCMAKWTMEGTVRIATPPSEGTAPSSRKELASDIAAYRKHIQEVRRSNDIAEVLAKYDNLAERNLANCPFHGGASPAPRIDKVDQSFECQRCGATGDVIRLEETVYDVSFITAIQRLAERANLASYAPTQTEASTICEDRNILEIRTEAARYCLRRLKAGSKNLLMRETGLPEDILERFRIGWADGHLRVHLLERRKVDLDLCIRAGVLAKSSKGRVEDRFQDCFVFPSILHGFASSLVGWKRGKNRSRYIDVLDEPSVIYNEGATRKAEIYLVRDPLEVFSLEAWGLPSVACRTRLDPNSDEIRKLQRAKRILICYPGGAKQLEDAVALGRLLGPRARIVRLPNRKTVQNLYRDGERDIFDSLVDEAKLPVQLSIEGIPEGTPKTTLPSLLDSVLLELATLNPAIADAVLSHDIKDRFELKPGDLIPYRKVIEQHRRHGSGPDKPDGPDHRRRIIWRPRQKGIQPAQDVVDGTLYYCVYLPLGSGNGRGGTDLEERPHIVTSKREVFLLDSEELASRGLRMDHEHLIPSNTRRWTIGPELPQSVYGYLNNQAQINPVILHEFISSLYRIHVDYPDRRYPAFLGLWCMGTYIYKVFEAYPYVFLLAQKGSGKTQTTRISAELCFNALAGVAMTEASIFRSVARDCSTLIYDEAGKLKGVRGGTTDTFAILNSGYKRGGSVPRTAPDGRRTLEFPTYSPKMIANIEGLHTTTLDRTITVRHLPSEKDVPKLSTPKLEEIFAETRDILHIFGLNYHSPIAQRYESIEATDAIRGRDLEIWRPIFAMAKFLDGWVHPRSKTPLEDRNLFDQMYELAVEGRRLKRHLDQEGNLELIVLEGLIDLLDFTGCRYGPQFHRQATWYDSDKLLSHLRRYCGLPSLTKNALTRILTNLQIMRDPSRDKRRKRSSVKLVQMYLLRPERVIEAARRYGLEVPFAKEEPVPESTPPQSKEDEEPR